MQKPPNYNAAILGFTLVAVVIVYFTVPDTGMNIYLPQIIAGMVSIVGSSWFTYKEKAFSKSGLKAIGLLLLIAVGILYAGYSVAMLIAFRNG